MPRTHHRPSNEGIAVTITALNENGYGVGQKAGQTFHCCENGAGRSGDSCSPKLGAVDGRRSGEVTKPGPDRVASGCAAFDRGCGGCQWLHLWPIPAQLVWKEKNLTAMLRTKAGYKGTIHPIAGHGRRPRRTATSVVARRRRPVRVHARDRGRIAGPRDCRVQTRAPCRRRGKLLRGFQVAPGIDQAHLR